MECPFEQIALIWWHCSQCNRLYYGSEKWRWNCPNAPAALERRKRQEAATAEAADKLGITPEHVVRYAKALWRWSKAGFPVRTDAEVAAIYAEHCKPCDEMVDGRCDLCGCPVAEKKGMAARNKIAMKTESCPDKKW